MGIVESHLLGSFGIAAPRSGWRKVKQLTSAIRVSGGCQPQINDEGCPRQMIADV